MVPKVWKNFGDFLILDSLFFLFHFDNLVVKK